MVGHHGQHGPTMFTRLAIIILAKWLLDAATVQYLFVKCSNRARQLMNCLWNTARAVEQVHGTSQSVCTVHTHTHTIMALKFSLPVRVGRKEDKEEVPVNCYAISIHPSTDGPGQKL